VRRVVADTNVLVSALQFGGRPKQLLDLAVDGHIDLAISEAIVQETLRVLRDKFQRTTEELAETSRQLRIVGRMVTPTKSIKAVAADPSDDRILECAVAATAEIIVSGDKHLLDLGSFRGILIKRVGEFLAAFQERGPARPDE
jgi:putative PIN family toxin of toxin-antitoxin system